MVPKLQRTANWFYCVVQHCCNNVIMQPILFMICLFLYALVNMLNLLEHCVLSCVAIICSAVVLINQFMLTVC